MQLAWKAAMMWCSVTGACSVRQGTACHGHWLVMEGRTRHEEDDVILEKHNSLYRCTDLGMPAGRVAQYGPESLEWAGVEKCAVMHSHPATCTHTHIVDAVVTIFTSCMMNEASADCLADMMVL